MLVESICNECNHKQSIEVDVKQELVKQANQKVEQNHAKKIAEITKDAIFVAHNVNFDYNIIRDEFKSLGFDFKRKKLCTVRLSRKIIWIYGC